MDILRALLCLGLVLLAWKLQFRGIRPVRDFLVWGTLYPIHFLFSVLLILIIWGVIGADFGLQGLFLDEDPLTQVLLGSTMMILFAAIITHYSVVGESSRGWRNSLKGLVRFFQLANPIEQTQFPIQFFLRNGFLNALTKEDIDSLGLALQKEDSQAVDQPSKETRILSLVDEETFRLLISPAVILVKGFMLMFLVGAVPTLVIPLLNHDSITLVERLPWLVGVCIGNVLGILIACWTTQWATSSPKGMASKQRILSTIREGTAPGETTGKQALNAGLPAHKETMAPMPSWVLFLLVFFTLHFFVNNLLPDSVSATWLTWPEHHLIDASESSPSIPDWTGVGGSVPWLPLMVLTAEAATSGMICLLIHLLPKFFPHSISTTWIPWVRNSWQTGIGFTLRSLSQGKVLIFLGATGGLVAMVCLVIAVLVYPGSTSTLWPGLRGYASLGSMLALWIGAFWLATHAHLESSRNSPFLRSMAGTGAFCLLVMNLLHVNERILFPVSWLTLALSGSWFLVQTMRPIPKTMLALLLLFVGISGLGLLAFFASETLGCIDFATKLITSWAILFLGAMALSSMVDLKPSLLFPMTVFLSFLAFAIPYNALPEEFQASLPAAGSIACFLALLAAIYSVLVFARPQSAFFIAFGLVCALVLWNGVALFVNPNHFKSTFPNMANYYSLPVYLDSKDYFRSTTPTTVQLRNRSVIDDFDRMNEQSDSQRLATAYFRKPKMEKAVDGSSRVSVFIDDNRSRLRAVVGDQVRLTGEEWFTVKIDGKDCIALAEEPFFQKIFSLFQYGTLDLMRDGIIRGPKFFLFSETKPAQAPPRPDARWISYRFITHKNDQPTPIGIRLHDLAKDYQSVKADYVLIAMNWTGRITQVERSTQSDLYTVQFDLPTATEPFNETELEIMGTWLERCHLDVLRTTVAMLPTPRDGHLASSLSETIAANDGNCLILDDCRSEAPTAIATFLVGTENLSRQYPAFERVWLTKQNLEEAIATTPRPNKNASAEIKNHEQSFTLRRIHDRGIFAFFDPSRVPPQGGPQKSTKAFPCAIYNANRLRTGDRVILTWNASAGPATLGVPRKGGVFEVIDSPGTITDPFPVQGLPPGYQTMHLVPVHATVDAPEPATPQDQDRQESLRVGEWQIVQPLNNTEVLGSWKKVVGQRWKGQLPKLVIITVSGGGIRSSVWTSIVLRKLEATLGSDFPYHIRLITGASGGMVGASHFATSLVPPTSSILAGERLDFSTLHNTPKLDFLDRVATGQLDALLGRMVFADFPGTLNPFMKKADRGRTLEETWVRWTGGAAKSSMGRSLQSFAADERTGWRPSMVYTPMMVEDGRRILISNLDMAFATRNIGGLLIEPSSRKIERATIQGGDFDLSIHDEDDLFSLSAIEFFRLFPQAHDFRVTTAARMSASFPWISPAVNLPTLPPRRVVDAAYYDNYGVNLSALWISKMSSWLQENTSGVLVIQIRDNVSQAARTEIDFDRLAGKKSALDRLTWDAWGKLVVPGLQAITTPLIGISNARQWTMAFRNDEQVDLLDLIFDQDDRKFFRTVVFECPVDVSLSWKLTEHEKEILLSGFGHPETAPRDELAKIKDYLIGKDSYEFHKWQVENRNHPQFHQLLKEKYDEQLRHLGFRGTNRFTLRQSQVLYENVMKNLKRLDILSDWWKENQN